MNVKGTLIEALSSSYIFCDYERAFNETTALPMTLRPVEWWQLPLHGRPKENAFCALMAGQSRTCAACLQTQEELCHGAKKQAQNITCNYGLCEIAVPVRLGTETIGFLQTGQVFRQPPTGAQFERAARKLEKLDIRLDREQLKHAFFAGAVVTPKKLESITQLLTIFAGHLSLLSNQIALQKTNAEPPVITRAKQYITEHRGESLSLSQVARTVNTSTFYFCKLFKKATGINFTEFVSRSRIEQAKNLLLNPNLRISEIAFEVGFQSLTHFNRVFKKLLGQSPTEYRGRLPAAPI